MTKKVADLLGDEPLLSRERAGLMLGEMNVRSIDYLIATGQLESRKIGRRRLVTRVSVMAYAKRDHARVNPKKG